MKGLRVPNDVKEIKLEEVWLQLESKSKFPERITHKIFKTNSSFDVK